MLFFTGRINHRDICAVNGAASRADLRFMLQTDLPALVTFQEGTMPSSQRADL
jgi:hypothetical protein